MEFIVTKENYTMTAEVKVIGKDLFIAITGGDNPHIGTVTTLTRDTKLQTIKYPSHDGRFHKDDVLAIRVGKIIQPVLLGSCTITAGVHVNHISKKQIMVSSQMSQNLGNQIKTWLQKTDFKIAEPIYYSDKENPTQKIINILQLQDKISVIVRYFLYYQGGYLNLIFINCNIATNVLIQVKVSSEGLYY